MLTRDGCIRRREKLWEMIPRNVDWVILTDPGSILYFSAFHINPFSFSANEEQFLLLQRKGYSILITDLFSHNSVTTDFFVDEIKKIDWYDQIRSATVRKCMLHEELSRIITRLNKDKYIIENDTNSFVLEADISEGQDFINLQEIIQMIREIKEPDEIELLKYILKLSKSGHDYVKNNIHPGKSEKEIYNGLNSIISEKAKYPYYIYGDFRASTKKKPCPGGSPTNHILSQDELYILDYSIVIQGYRSDTTNTIPVGETTLSQKELLSVCKDALKAGEKVLQPGAAGKDIYIAMKNFFSKAGYPDALPHHGGHGIGISHLETPFIVPESKDLLAPGNVLTLEPGIYEKGRGGVRLEHNYLITDAGFKRLSNHTLGA